MKNAARAIPQETPALQAVPNCSCPHHVVDPSQMCPTHQKEYCAYLDEQCELDAIQQRYENEMDR